MDNHGLKIMVIPDTQVKPDVPTDHMLWIGEYLVDKKPDRVVHLGDHWDMSSLSSYDKGKRCYEGRSYKRDIVAGNNAMTLLMSALEQYNDTRRQYHEKLYQPGLDFLLGNHEQRIERAVEMDRMLEDTIGYHDFNLEAHGWTVHPFLQPLEINGVYFAHYFYNPLNGRPYGGMPETRLKNVGHTFVQGHQQGLKTALMSLSTGEVRRAVIAGSCYLHDEEYIGPQGNHYWRGILMLHEVEDGNFDMMEVSLNFLKRRYEAKRK